MRDENGEGDGDGSVVINYMDGSTERVERDWLTNSQAGEMRSEPLALPIVLSLFHYLMSTASGAAGGDNDPRVLAAKALLARAGEDDGDLAVAEAALAVAIVARDKTSKDNIIAAARKLYHRSKGLFSIIL